MPIWKRYFDDGAYVWTLPASEIKIGDIVITQTTTRLILSEPILISSNVSKFTCFNLKLREVCDDHVSHFGYSTKLIRDGEIIFDATNPPSPPPPR